MPIELEVALPLVASGVAVVAAWLKTSNARKAGEDGASDRTKLQLIAVSARTGSVAYSDLVMILGKVTEAMQESDIPRQTQTEVLRRATSLIADAATVDHIVDIPNTTVSPESIELIQKQREKRTKAGLSGLSQL